MTSSEAFGAQLSSKLEVDLTGLREQIKKGKHAAAATEQQAAELQESREESAAAIAASLLSLEQERASVGAVLQLVSGFEADSASLEREVRGAAEGVAREAANTRSIRERIALELDEAQARLSHVEGQKSALDREVDALVAAVEPAEEAAEGELRALRDAAIALRLKSALALKARRVYEAEAIEVKEGASAAQLHGAKAARAAESRRELAKLEAQLAADESTIARLDAKEKEVEMSVEEARARSRLAMRALDSQLDAAKRLVTRQDGFLKEKLEQAAARESAPASETALLGVAIEFVRQQRENALQELRSLEGEIGAFHDETEAAASRRALELRQLRAESKAVHIALQHRAKFIVEKKAQLVRQEGEAAETASGVEGRDACAEMVAAELDAARALCEAIDAQAAAAERARADKSREVDELKASHRTGLAVLRARLSSETSVLVEQRRYVQSLHARLREEGMQCVDPPAGALAEGSLVGRGHRVVEVSAAAACRFVEELEQRREACEASIKEATETRQREEKRGVAEARRLEEQHVAMVDALRKMQQYEEALETSLAALPPASEVASEAALPTKPLSPPAALVRATSDVIEIGAPATAPAAPRGTAEEMAMLKSLRSSAELAIGAAHLIGRYSAGSATTHNQVERAAAGAA